MIAILEGLIPVKPEEEKQGSESSKDSNDGKQTIIVLFFNFLLKTMTRNLQKV